MRVLFVYLDWMCLKPSGSRAMPPPTGTFSLPVPVPPAMPPTTGTLSLPVPTTTRTLSLPKSVAKAGGLDAWNASHPELRHMLQLLGQMCTAQTVTAVLDQVHAIIALGHPLWAYAYMRMLYNRSADLYYATLLAEPSKLLPVVYTPTVGEACQKYGLMPQFRRGCYVSLSDRGRVREVLAEYARAELGSDASGQPLCDCIVFSDGGRILGLGDLGAWGMGIPIGKLDLYTVCAGVNPHRTVPLILDAGCFGAEGNTDSLVVRDSPLYTGMKEDRVTDTSAAGTRVNAAYYGHGSIIEELFEAATSLFGRRCAGWRGGVGGIGALGGGKAGRAPAHRVWAGIGRWAPNDTTPPPPLPPLVRPPSDPAAGITPPPAGIIAPPVPRYHPPPPPPLVPLPPVPL